MCHVNGSSASSGSTPNAQPPPRSLPSARTCPWRRVFVVGESVHHRGWPQRVVRLPGPTCDRSTAETLDLATGACSTDANEAAGGLPEPGVEAFDDVGGVEDLKGGGPICILANNEDTVVSPRWVKDWEAAFPYASLVSYKHERHISLARAFTLSGNASKCGSDFMSEFGKKD